MNESESGFDSVVVKVVIVVEEGDIVGEKGIRGTKNKKKELSIKQVCVHVIHEERDRRQIRLFHSSKV